MLVGFRGASNMYLMGKVISEYTSSVKKKILGKSTWILFQPKVSDISKNLKSNIVQDMPEPMELPGSSKSATIFI